MLRAERPQSVRECVQCGATGRFELGYCRTSLALSKERVSAANETAPRGTTAGRSRGLAPCFAWRQSAANHHGRDVIRVMIIVPVTSVVVLQRATKSPLRFLVAGLWATT